MDRISPDNITELKENEIFVFGSNIHGVHGGGAARTAYRLFGAEWGNGTGLQGKSYAIPTMEGSVNRIWAYVDEFLIFAECHPEMKFLVTRIGCGIAGYTDEQIAPFFAKALSLENVWLPKSFIEVLKK